MGIKVIGAGLAGSEAAYQLAKRGYKVDLYECRPVKKMPAHHTDYFAELVCSNSLKSNSLENAAGLLKEEMRVLDSIIIKTADDCAVPAGQALAVDRDVFGFAITEKITTHKNITVHYEEVLDINPEDVVIIASGPLTSEGLSKKIQELVGGDYLYFYDAAAPLVLLEGIDFSKAYYKSRYDKGDGKDYINCPFEKDEFMAFYQELVRGQRVELKEFEKELHFEACMPIESIAAKGYKTLTFGPLKPRGLEKEDGTRPYAVVQLRQDNQEGTMYNMVGFQTNLLFKEQERIFRMIPGLENAKFVRHGVMHRNTFINSPDVLNRTLNLRKYPKVFFAGQIVGVEGYVESAATGIIAAINVINLLENKQLICPPRATVLGALLEYIETSPAKHFQPMNANYGVLASPLKDKQEIAKVSIETLKEWMDKHGV